jgi:hypothetical protein
MTLIPERIPADDRYLRDLGRATYNFAYLEWGVIWIGEKLDPGFLNKVTPLNHTDSAPFKHPMPRPPPRLASSALFSGTSSPVSFAQSDPGRLFAKDSALAQLQIYHSPAAPAGRQVAPRLDPRTIPLPDPFDTAPFFLTLDSAEQNATPE